MKKKLAIFAVVFAMLSWYFCTNSNPEQMTTKQKIIKTLYPVIQLFSTKKDIKSPNSKQPLQSFYDLRATANDGNAFDFSVLKNKKILLVNTASDCGYTPQYKALQSLYEKYKNKLVIIAFPANDFKEQEKADDATIASFCEKNYGVSFPLMKKSVVISSPQQNEVFQWLTRKDKNGWNDKAPEWNFSKYLVNEKGELTHYFSPGMSPLDNKIRQAIAE